MVVVFMMDRELVQLLTVKVSSAMCTDPWQEFEREGSIALFAMRRDAPCHESLRSVGDSARPYSTPDLRVKHATRRE
jgi:hypothetical protein